MVGYLETIKKEKQIRSLRKNKTATLFLAAKIYLRFFFTH